MQTQRAPHSTPQTAETATPISPACHRGTRKQSGQQSGGCGEQVGAGAAVSRRREKLELTDIKGIEHVAGSLGVVAAAPDVDGVVDEHGRVPIPHVGHLPHLVTAVCPHWGQLDPAQGHCKHTWEPLSVLTEPAELLTVHNPSLCGGFHPVTRCRSSE